KMILLSKVFPTLDCASCIATPKMAAVRNNPRIRILTVSEVRKISRNGSSFELEIEKKPTYVDPEKCTGCGECEKVCPVPRPDQFNAGLTVRRAVYIPFPQAVPKKALIEKRGLSPCSRFCPLGVRAHALVALLRQGRYQEALKVHLEAAPFPGALSRICEAPCEKRCTLRAQTGRPMSIRALKGFIFQEAVRNLSLEWPQAEGPRVALLGEGPLSLSCAYFLRKAGFQVFLFAEKGRLGGSLRAHPEIPEEFLEEDLRLILEGIELQESWEEAPEKLLEEGFAAVFLERAPGTKVDPRTFETTRKGVFAPPEVPASLLQEIHLGKEAAARLRAALEGKKVSAPYKLPKSGPLEGERRLLSEEEALREASRCLDCAGCCECRSCERACPAGAINFSQKAQKLRVEAGAVVLATGFRLFEPEENPLWGYRKYPNVITGMQLERLLAPTRPYNAVMRPSDGRIPGNIALVLCVGSRSLKEGTPRCSRICCMYSLKQAQLLLGAVPFAEVTIYYIDLRAFGKGYEEFLRQTQAMGVHLKKGRVARIEPAGKGDLWVYYEDMEGAGGVKRARHDLVVLATGALAEPALQRIVSAEIFDELGFVKEAFPEKAPGQTALPGVFVVGAAAGPRDIPDTVVHAQAVALQVVLHLRRSGFAA
ncbi:MAG: hypothetical protein DSZ24_06105, partial [Thermodesulfatator sp.]